MREANLKPVWKRKYIHTTDSKHNLPIVANILVRQFNPSRPNTAFVTDITYVRTGTSWLYLVIVLDLYSRKVVGWAMAPSMPAELVCTALQMAIQTGQPSTGLIVHLTKTGHLTVPHPKKDLGTGLVQKILKQAGLK